MGPEALEKQGLKNSEQNRWKNLPRNVPKIRQTNINNSIQIRSAERRDQQIMGAEGDPRIDLDKLKGIH